MSDLRAKRKLDQKSRWSFKNELAAPVFEQLRVIREWGIGRPSEFGICLPADDLNMMVAFERQYSRMVEWETEEMNKRYQDRMVRHQLARTYGKKAH